jgi:HAD superfamily hydrolase (TIGR01484 family)
MLPITRISRDEARRLEGLLFDLDDTLLDHGKLTETAYSALFRLREAGLSLYVVTGRPSPWAHLLTRIAPIDGGVAENGAIAWTADGKLLDPAAGEQRNLRRSRTLDVVDAVRRTFPDLEPADDAYERLTDFTFDIGERRRVGPERVAAVTAFARERGANVHTSSVHLHVTFDALDKASGAIRMLRAVSAGGVVDPTAVRDRYAFIGDSENDAACFAAFPISIGVANLRGRPTVSPRFRTSAPRGAGFAEAARVISALRG